MKDFVTRLAERAMGTAPVVQPLVASMFAPEPASHLMEPEVPDRTPRTQTPPDTPTLVPDEAELEEADPDTSATPQSSAPDAAAPARPEPSRHAPTWGQEDLDAPDTLGPPRRERDAGEAGPLETGMESRQEIRQNLSAPGSRPLRSGETLEREAVTQRSPRDPSRMTIASGRALSPQTRFETIHSAVPAPARRGVAHRPRRLVPEGMPFDPVAAENGPGQAKLRSTVALAERAQVAVEAPAPPPGADDSLKASEETPGSEILPAHHATQDADPAIVPRIIRREPDQRQESSPREPRVLAPEPPAPTIRVAIGRIEVRTITPPPARQEKPDRPGPLLSLDDYLKQRNGGHR